MQRIASLYVAHSEKEGRGVFTATPIPNESVIEICPMIVLKPEDTPEVDKTELFNYYFLWGEQEDIAAIALGYGSLYNHSFEPNARYLANYEDDTLTFCSIRDIEPGEEITVNYNGLPDIQERFWLERELY